MWSGPLRTGNYSTDDFEFKLMMPAICKMMKEEEKGKSYKRRNTIGFVMANKCVKHNSSGMKL